MSDAIVVCKTCGLHAKVRFGAAGEIVAIFSVCGHLKMPAGDSPPERRKQTSDGSTR